MKIVFLLRFPKVDKSNWKINLINNIRKDHNTTLIFGESSLLSHLKYAVKMHGFGLIKEKKKLEQKKVNSQLIYSYFKNITDTHKVEKLNGTYTCNILRKINPDLIVLLGTGIIRKNVLDIPKIGTIHCHQGKLPKFKGMSPIEWSIFYNNDVYITTHFIDPGIDTGKILLEQKINITDEDDIESIRQKCQKNAVNLIIKTIESINNKSIIPISQKKKEGRQYFKIHPALMEIVNKKISKLSSR